MSDGLRCPKCGYPQYTIERRISYHKAGCESFDRNPDALPCDNVGSLAEAVEREHLQRTCHQCRYRWPLPCPSFVIEDAPRRPRWRFW